jgi:hypothetical protein
VTTPPTSVTVPPWLLVALTAVTVSVCEACSADAPPAVSLAVSVVAWTEVAPLGRAVNMSAAATGGWLTVTVLCCVRHAGGVAESHARTATTHVASAPAVKVYVPVVPTVPPQVSSAARLYVSAPGVSVSTTVGV